MIHALRPSLAHPQWKRMLRLMPGEQSTLFSASNPFSSGTNTSGAWSLGFEAWHQFQMSPPAPTFFSHFPHKCLLTNSKLTILSANSSIVWGLRYLGLSLWNEEELMPVHGLSSLQGLSPLYQWKPKSRVLGVMGTSQGTIRHSQGWKDSLFSLFYNNIMPLNKKKETTLPFPCFAWYIWDPNET